MNQMGPAPEKGEPMGNYFVQSALGVLAVICNAAACGMVEQLVQAYQTNDATLAKSILQKQDPNVQKELATKRFCIKENNIAFIQELISHQVNLENLYLDVELLWTEEVKLLYFESVFWNIHIKNTTKDDKIRDHYQTYHNNKKLLACLASNNSTKDNLEKARISLHKKGFIS
jgi:hypothetical protein